MLPTPSTSHVSFDAIYEPAEDSYLFLDTLSSKSETSWLSNRFSPISATNSHPPLITELGTGSGVVLAFIAASARSIFGREDILALGTDVNRNACKATQQTVLLAINDKRRENDCDFYHSNRNQAEGEKSFSSDHTTDEHSADPQFLASLIADLCTPLRPGSVDVLIFNPPYVPTPDLPPLSPLVQTQNHSQTLASEGFEHESYLLSLTYAGGLDGMEITNRFLDTIPEVLDPRRGVAYVLLCAQNKPEEVKKRIRAWGDNWMALTVGRSGMQAGWEKLIIVRIWRDRPGQ
jgi:release factor glutamine methyltransferase